MSALLNVSVYSEGIASEVVRCVAEGQSLPVTCRQPGFPTLEQVSRWRRRHDRFNEELTEAEEVRAEHLVQEALDIADDNTNDVTTYITKNGREVETLDYEHVARSKLRIVARQWQASRLNRQKYGDRQQVDVNARVLNINMSDEDLDKKLNAMNARLLDIVNP